MVLEAAGRNEVSAQARVLASMLAGAAIGGVVGWLYYTESGRSFRREAEPRLEAFRLELQRLRATVRKASEVAADSLESLRDVLGESPPASRWPGPVQVNR